MEHFTIFRELITRPWWNVAERKCQEQPCPSQLGVLRPKFAAFFNRGHRNEIEWMRNQSKEVARRPERRCTFAEICCEASRYVDSLVPRNKGRRRPHQIGPFWQTERAPQDLTSPLKVFPSSRVSKIEHDGRSRGDRASTHPQVHSLILVLRMNEQIAGVRFFGYFDSVADLVSVLNCPFFKGLGRPRPKARSPKFLGSLFGSIDVLGLSGGRADVDNRDLI